MSTIINGTSSAITFPDSSVQNTAGLVAGGTIATGTVTTLTTTTISDGTNSTSATNPIRGSAKAWVNLTNNGGGAVTVNRSFNVSSVTTASGYIYYVNVTNALPNTNIVPWALCNQLGVNTYANQVISTTQFGFATYTQANAAYSPASGTQTFVVIFGD